MSSYTNWLAMTASLLQDLQCRALLKATLKTHQVLSRDQVDLVLELTNGGRSPASNITVTLLPGPDYVVVQGRKELDILGAHLGPYCYPLAMDMLVKGQVPVDEIVTHAFPLDAYQTSLDMVHEAEVSIKVMLEP